jgi:hypothetical protein
VNPLQTQSEPDPQTIRIRRDHRIERVLIYRLGSLGDTIVALPALHVVERAFPQSAFC